MKYCSINDIIKIRTLEKINGYLDERNKISYTLMIMLFFVFITTLIGASMIIATKFSKFKFNLNFYGIILCVFSLGVYCISMRHHTHKINELRPVKDLKLIKSEIAKIAKTVKNYVKIYGMEKYIEEKASLYQRELATLVMFELNNVREKFEEMVSDYNFMVHILNDEFESRQPYIVFNEIDYTADITYNYLEELCEELQ